MLGIPAQQAVVGCKFLHHFIFKKQMFVFVIFLFVLDCTFFLFLLSAQIKRERKYQRKRKISLFFRTLRVHHAPKGHLSRVQFIAPFLKLFYFGVYKRTLPLKPLIVRQECPTYNLKL